MKTKLILVLAAIAVLCFAAWSSKASHSSRDNWEYKLVTVQGMNIVPASNPTQLNELGSEGWELVTVNTEEVVFGSHRQIKIGYYLKRRI
jgi:hypothetical protein